MTGRIPTGQAMAISAISPSLGLSVYHTAQTILRIQYPGIDLPQHDCAFPEVDAADGGRKMFADDRRAWPGTMRGKLERCRILNAAIDAPAFWYPWMEFTPR